MLGGGVWSSGGGSVEGRISNLEGKNVRTTRFASIGSGTGGTVTLPPNATVVLDDFGGTVDAVVTQVSGGRPLFTAAVTSGGAVVAAAFDASGNYSLSGTPSAYPVALIYRVTQALEDFDSGSSDIVGPPMISSDAAAVSGNNNRFITKDGSGVVASNDSFRINAKGALEFSHDDTVADSESHALNTEYVGIIPSEDAPDTTVTVHSKEASVDPDDSGFDLGRNGNALNLHSNFIRAEGTGDVGGLAIFSNSFSIGDGTNPIAVKGFSYSFGFGEVRSGVDFDGPMQGYGFQPIVRAGATVDPNNSYTTAFYDNMTYEGDASYHTSFNSGPTIENLPSGRNYTGFNASPTIDTFAANSGYTGVSVGGNLGTFGASSYFNGVSVNPNITSARYAAGINVTMDNVTVYAGVAASRVIQDLTFAADLPGTTANGVTIEYTGGGTAGAEVVSVVGLTVEVQIESGVSTATQIANALNAFPGFTLNLNVTISGTGSNPQTIQGPVNLQNGEDPGTKKAAYLDGDVEITGSLQFGGALSIGQLNAFASQAMFDGGGTPASIHGLVSAPTVADNVTVANADTIGINTAMLLTLGDNAVVTTSFVGVAALALPAVVNLGASATIDQVSGGTFAVSMDPGAGAGGAIDNLDLCRSLAIPNGITTINTLSGYKFDLPFGNPGTTTWGFYESPGVNNYFAGNLLIGGTAGSDDTVTNSSVALEIKSTTKAAVEARMTETERDALTAVNGMLLYNTTSSKFQGYAGGSWVNLH